MLIQRIQLRQFVAGILIIGLLLTISCKNTETSIENSNLPNSNENPVRQPAEAPNKILEDKQVDADDLISEKKSHEKLYSGKEKILSALTELTKMNRKYQAVVLSERAHDGRKEDVYRIVDKLYSETTDSASSDDGAFHLIILAELCQSFGKSHLDSTNFSYSSASSSYEIAFFYIIKIVSTKHSGNERLVNQMKSWVKKYSFDGIYAADFLLALSGHDPKFLYGEEPSAAEMEMIEKLSKSIVWR